MEAYGLSRSGGVRNMEVEGGAASEQRRRHPSAPVRKTVVARASACPVGTLADAWPAHCLDVGPGTRAETARKSACATADLSQQRVREAGLAAGLVDYKICAIDESWSALCFTQRKTPRRRA